MEVFGDHLLYNIYGFEDCVVRCRGKVGGGSVLGLQGEGQVDEVGLIEVSELSLYISSVIQQLDCVVH